MLKVTEKNLETVLDRLSPGFTYTDSAVRMIYIVISVNRILDMNRVTLVVVECSIEDACAVHTKHILYSYVLLNRL